MTTKKTILAGIFSLIVGIGMLALPIRAMAHDWDHDGDRGHHEHWNRGNHYGWDKHRGGWDNDAWRYHREPDADDYEDSDDDGYGYRGNGYGNGFAYPYTYGNYPYNPRINPRNGQGMISRTHPNLMWTCDSQGHHCHWAQRQGWRNGYYNGSYGYGNGFFNNQGYGNGYYGNTPFDALGSMFGLTR